MASKESKSGAVESVTNVSLVGGAALLMTSWISSDLNGYTPDTKDFLLTATPFAAALVAEFFKFGKGLLDRYRAARKIAKLKRRAQALISDENVSGDARGQAQRLYDCYCLLEIHPDVTMQVVEAHSQRAQDPSNQG